MIVAQTANPRADVPSKVRSQQRHHKKLEIDAVYCTCHLLIFAVSLVTGDRLSLCLLRCFLACDMRSCGLHARPALAVLSLRGLARGLKPFAKRAAARALRYAGCGTTTFATTDWRPRPGPVTARVAHPPPGPPTGSTSGILVRPHQYCRSTSFAC